MPIIFIATLGRVGGPYEAGAVLADLELLQLPEEGRAADAEDLGGLVAVAVGLVEGMLQIVAVQAGVGAAGAGQGDLAEELAVALGVLDRERVVGGEQGQAVDLVLELAHVAGPF